MTIAEARRAVKDAAVRYRDGEGFYYDFTEALRRFEALVKAQKRRKVLTASTKP